MLLAVGLGNTENESLKQTFIPFFPLLLGLSLLCLAQQAMVDGYIFRLRYAIVKNKHPIRFWMAVVFYDLLGAILFISGIGQWL